MKNIPHPSLYVKSFKTYMGEEFGIASTFAKARAFAPCMLILEDLDSLLNPSNRSFFLNEVDGLEENDGILVVGTTNHLELLDPGIVNRPSRFDRKYCFPLPSLDERKQYCKYWQAKLTGNNDVDFPDKLVDRIGALTSGFSFAYLKEAFVSALVIIAAGDGGGKGGGGEGEEGLFERVIVVQIQNLREQIGE
jgi:SpoVK/Ycf46/Vps4 family AAA+-type ATPase